MVVLLQSLSKVKDGGRREWRRITELHSEIISAGFHPQVISSNAGFHTGVICNYVWFEDEDQLLCSTPLKQQGRSLFPALTNLVGTCDLKGTWLVNWNSIPKIKTRQSKWCNRHLNGAPDTWMVHQTLAPDNPSRCCTTQKRPSESTELSYRVYYWWWL